jgi:hypothetical protein
MQALTFNILGFPAVNRDLKVEVRDPVTGTPVATITPFLDGTAKVPAINPGLYEVFLHHDNLVTPVLKRRIRVLPVGDTSVSLLIDPSQFRNTAIEDIPDANLGPVRDLADSVAETVAPLTAKQPGEAITAADNNTMAAGIRDLAETITQLTRLVTPLGHNHVELERKLEEITGNFTALVESLGAAMTELQRQIQNLRLRKQVDDLVNVHGLQNNPRVQIIRNTLRQLDETVTESPIRFGRVSRNAGVQVQTALEQIIDDRSGDPAFVDSAEVKQLTQSVDLLREQRADSYTSELEHLRKVDRVFGKGGLSDVIQNGG